MKLSIPLDFSVSPTSSGRRPASYQLRAIPWYPRSPVYAAILALFLLIPNFQPALAQITNIGNALTFDGTTNAAVITSPFQGFPSDSITVEFWALSSDTTRSSGLFSYGAQGSPATFLIYDHRNLSVWINNDQRINSGISINDGNWHHVAVTWSSSGPLQIFKDGALAFSTNRAEVPLADAGTLVLGQQQHTIGGGFNATEAFSGDMDEVRVWSIIRTSADIAQNANTLLEGNEPGLVACYHFNEGIGTTTSDSTSQGHNLTLNSGVNWFPLAPYNAGGALNYTNGYVQVPSSPAFNTLPMTLMMWMRTVGTTTKARWVVTRGPGNPTDWFMSVDPNGTLSADYFAGPASVIAIQQLNGGNAGPVNDGLWHHAAFTVDTNGGRLYVDGILKASRGWSGTSAVATSTNDLYIGSRDFPFTGQLDELSVWNVALDPAAIQTNMNRKLTGAEQGLLAAYHLDEGSGTLVNDASPGQHNGTFVGNPFWITSGARIHGYSQISGQVIAGAIGAPNIPVSAGLPPVVVQPVLSIPDVSTAVSTNFIPLSSTIGSLTVAVNITHPFAGDLELTLIHPDGTEIRLKDADATDDSVNVITSYPNLTQPVQSLAALNGKPVAGAWLLRVRDAFPQDTGVLNTWSLQFGGPPAITDVNGNYTLSNLLTVSNFFAQTYTVQPVRDGFLFNPTNVLAPPNSSNVDFTLISGFISGQVVDQNSGLGGVTISGGPGLSTTTDPNGNYRLTGLPPPAATLTASLPGYSFSQPQIANIPLGATQVVFVVAGYPVAGTVTDAQSNGVLGVTLSAAGTNTMTDGQGQYLLAGVPRGRNTITPYKPGVSFSPSNLQLNVLSAVSNVNFAVTQSPPTITVISDQVIAKNASTGPVRFDVNDAETPPAFLGVAGFSSNTNLVPNANILFDGVGVQRTVSITPASDKTGTANITVVVTDTTAQSASNTFALRVNQAPQPGVGLALSFDGNTNFVSAGTNVIFPKGTFTVEAWVSAPSNAGPRTLLSQGPGFTIGVDASRRIHIGTNWNTGVSFPFGAWHHVAVVRDTADTRLYVDGVLSASKGSAIPFPLASDRFQAGALGGAEFWLGSIDELRVWRVARSGSEVASNLTVRITGNDQSLSGLWRFDEPSGVALDSTPNGRDLTVFGPTRIASPIQFGNYVTFVGRDITDVLQAYDPDSDPLSFALGSPPSHGTVTLLSSNTGAFLFTADQAGQDQFTFTVSDGYAVSPVYPVSITILPDTNPPAISFIPDQVTAEDTLLGPITFTVGDTERAADQLVVFAHSSDQTLLPDAQIVISPGGGGSRTLSVLPGTNQFGSATITLTVSDGSQQSSTSFAVTVTPVHDTPVILPLTNMLIGSVLSYNQPIQVWAPDSAPGSLFFSIVGVTPISGSGYVITPTVSTCSYSNGAMPCVVLNAAGPYYSGTNLITVSVSDGISSSQTSFTVTLYATPVLQAISDQSTLRDIPTQPIPLVLIGYGPPPPGQGLLTFHSSNQTVVEDSGFIRDPVYSQFTIVPRPGAVGQTTITITFNDGVSSTSTSFQLVVKDVIDFEVVELPRLPGALGTDNAGAAGLNDTGQIVGYSEVGGTPHAVVWDVNGPSPTITPLFNTPSYGLRINNLGQIVGQNNGTAFLYTNGGSTTLGARLGYSSAMDINDNGEVVGSYDTASASLYFYYNGSSSTVLSNVFWAGTFGNGPSGDLALNAQGDVFGAGLDWTAGYPLPTNARLWTNRASRTLVSFDNLTGDPYYPIVGGINNSNWICVNFYDSSHNKHFPILFNYSTLATNNDFSTTLASDLPELYQSYGSGLNDSSQVVGFGSTVLGAAVPFLYSGGRAFRLADLMLSSGITPIQARAINKAGDIAGYGTRAGVTGVVPFVLRNQWLVGKPQSPPPLAIDHVSGKVFGQPIVSALDGTSGADLLRAYQWSAFEQKLYFLRPILAAVSWSTTTNLLDTNSPPIVQQWRVAWPRDSQIHVAGAPVNLDPVDPSSPYRPVALSYTTAGGGMDLGTRVFDATNTGYSVIQYLIASEVPVGGTPDILTHSNYFEVVRTVVWNDPAFLVDSQPATVGTKVSDPRGPLVSSNSSKSGWTIFPVAPYDGAGSDRAYDRATQTGPIIPVNTLTVSSASDLVVAFYKKSTLTSTLWPDSPVRFTISWPTNAEPLVIANSDGSGALPESQYPNKRIYVQSSTNLPGYNPNEEHAFLAPTTSGDGVFALRNDLNLTSTSEPFVLLKYRNPTNSEWQFKVYQPVLTDPSHLFTFSGDAGQEIQPPYPLRLFTICDGTTKVSGKAFRDFHGKYYASAGPTPSDPNPQVVMRFFYPLQPGFFYDLNGDGTNDLAVGDCVQWNAIPPGSSTAQPVDVTYRIRWPDDAPTLEIGETLLDPKRGLPGVKNWASAQVVFDSLNPDNANPLMTAARLYDPISARVLRLTNVVPANYQFPSEIALQTVGGKQIFSGLPYYLRSRLSYDPVNNTLSFAGFLNEAVLGEPLLLVNVLSQKERDRIKQLSGEANFQHIVDALYSLTRDPNGIRSIPPLITVSPFEYIHGLPNTFSADDLLVGLTVNYTTNIIPIFGVPVTHIFASLALEQLGGGPKALTAGLPVPPSNPNFGSALNFDGNGGYVSLPSDAFVFPVSGTDTTPFTFECWFNTTAGGVILGQQFGSPSQATGGYVPAIYVGTDGILRVEMFWAGAAIPITSASTVNDGNFHHLAVVYDGTTESTYLDGSSIGSVPLLQTAYNSSYNYQLGAGYTLNWPGGNGDWFYFNGQLDEVRLWNVARSTNDIIASKNQPLTGGEPGLTSYWRFDETSGTVTLDSTSSLHDGTISDPNSVTRVASGVPANGSAPRYMVIAENNDPALGALPVTLHVIRVDGGPFRGDLKIIFPDNVFDERLTLRHSSDFGADPDRLEFEWWYHPDDADFVDPTALPTVNADGSIDNPNGWLIYTPALTPNKFGQNTITIGDGGETSTFTLEDNWFISRYRGYNIGGRTNWSAWVGDPSSAEKTRAAFAPGWIKRVLEGINPFEARSTNFHQTAASTYASMLQEAGHRYEGDIALNPDDSNLNGIGLIEAYTTVLNRGKSLSIDGFPPVDSDPLNNALLLAASRISDLYMLLGNEAFADAEDPTIGFPSDSPEFGPLSTALFAFKNQLNSLLDEELALLRGRDDSAAGVGAAPVYNRLLWNFTGSDGEVAYVRTYNITDVNQDGLINEDDARILYPQGHGDAWGHYLTALTTYYDLLRHPRFTWIPRTDTVLIDGVAVQVDFLDERKFATAAAAKAQTGAHIVDLTYRSKYVDDPQGQYQGYKDIRTDRAWGVDEWARRAGQGAYFDWLVGNAILPSTDPNPNHTGIQKIDRQTVQELDQIISQHREVQSQMDKADGGLNPLGLAKGAVPFDIDPNFNIVGSAIQGQRHFEQIYLRAVDMLNNAVTVWDQANQLSEALRREQDTVAEFSANVADQERDYKSRLIESFGYPYAGDIGPGQTYPIGYDGPDIYHYMYVDATDLTGTAPRPAFTNNISGFFAPFTDGTNAGSFYFSNDLPAGTFISGPLLNVQFPLAEGDWAFTAPASFGARRAPGEVQLALSDLLQEETRLKIALRNYDSQLKQIQDAATLLQSRSELRNNTINELTQNRSSIVSINNTITGLQDAQLGLRRAAAIVDGVRDAVVDAIPASVAEAAEGSLAPTKGVLFAAGVVVSQILQTAADVDEGQQNRQEQSKEETQLQTDIDLETFSQDYELQQQAAELLSLLREEAPLRLEALNQAELVKQSLGRYQAAVASGQRLLQERITFRQRTAAATQQNRYNDMAFRIFRNEALQKYRAQFDLAARYVYLAATAYDYELNFLGSDNRSASDFFTDIIRQRSLGQVIDGTPVAGSSGLADALGRLGQNFAVLKSRFGLNNPQLETSRFSLRKELFRIRDDSDAQWRATLKQTIVPNLWDVPEFRRYCRPFAPESAGAQPGIVIRFPTTITFGLNFFGFPLGAGDSAYDPSLFTTKINSVGIWFDNYDSSGLAVAPRVYLLPVGMDVQRSPTGNTLATREWKIIDQAIPVPFPIGASSLTDPTWIPIDDSLPESFAQIRHFSSFRAYNDAGVYDNTQTTSDTRLIGRSVWNTDWMLIIPGGTFLFDPVQGLDAFINSISDIKLSLQSYSYSGD